jgi:branched-chain amino acid transport system substrate-binding protein
MMMTAMWRLIVVIALATAVAACGEDEDGGGGGAGDEQAKTLKVYSSLPLQGAAREQNVAIVNGAKLALEQAGGRAGKFAIKYESLDDSTAQAAGWEPGATTANARRAAQDDAAIAYIGEFNSGATALSLPLLNEAGLLQVSPGNTAVGITSDEPGAAAGEPDKYYPTGKRTYARLLPKDTAQGAALVAVMKEEGCASAYILNDKEVYGAGLARNVELAAKEQGLDITGNDGIDKNAANYRSLAAKIADTGADCFVYTGITANNAVQVFKDMAVALPDGKLFGPEGIAETGFFDASE